MPVETLDAQPDAGGDAAGAGSARPPAGVAHRAPPRWRTVLVVAAAFGAGVVLTGGLPDGGDADPSPPATIADVADDVDAAPPVPVDPSDAGVPAGQPAATPEAAVEAFLGAEADGDYEESYLLLSDEQRAGYRSAAAWVESHAQFFPVIDHELVEVRDDGTVVTDVRYRSTLDEIVGLVPARARVEWPTVATDGGWLVDFDAARATPVFPDEAEAPDAVADWAEALQRCEEPEQYAGALVSSLRLVREAEAICDSDQAIRTGSVRPLDAADASALVSAFGADAEAWARAVDLSGPVQLTVLVAPVADRWLVVGLLPPT